MLILQSSKCYVFESGIFLKGEKQSPRPCLDMFWFECFGLSNVPKYLIQMTA